MRVTCVILVTAFATSLFAVPVRSQDLLQSETSQAQPAVQMTRIKQNGTITRKALTHSVAPVYPTKARNERIQGTVRLHLIIAKDGSVQQAEVISGDKLLAQSALEAVRQWKYKVTLLNGEPVEVDTTEDLIFSLK
jgi:periplasmic protein TonB